MQVLEKFRQIFFVLQLVFGQDDVGLFVEMPSLQEGVVDILFQGFLVVLWGQGAFEVCIFQPVDECLFGDVEVYGDGVGVDVLHVVFEAGGAAACGDNGVGAGEKFPQHGLFTSSKSKFPILLQKMGNGGVVMFFHRGVQIDELELPLCGHNLGSRGFSGAREAHEHDGFHLIGCCRGWPR